MSQMTLPDDVYLMQLACERRAPSGSFRIEISSLLDTGCPTSAVSGSDRLAWGRDLRDLSQLITVRISRGLWKLIFPDVIRRLKPNLETFFAKQRSIKPHGKALRAAHGPRRSAYLWHQIRKLSL